MNTEPRIKSKDKLKGVGEAKSEIKFLRSVCQQLEEKIKLQNIALNTSTNSTAITDTNGDIIWVNNAFTKLTGYTLEESIGQNPRILKSGVHSNKFYKDIWKTISSGKEWNGEITNKKKNGTLYHERLSIYPVLNTDKVITNYVASKQDVTGQRLTDAALNESYIKYEELAYIFNQSPAIGFLWSDGDSGTVEFVTDNIKQWEYTPEDFYSQQLGFPDIIYEEDRTDVLSKISQEITNGNEQIKQQFRVITKNGKIRWVDSHMQVRLGGNGSETQLQGVVLDITDRKKAENDSKIQLEQLMQADKMIALGTLVSGVAHEINNPNNFVILNIPLIEKVWFNILPILEDHYNEIGDFNVGDRLKFSKIRSSMPLLLGGINEGSQRIKTIVEDLKSFARKDATGISQSVDLNEVVQASVNLTANLISKSTDRFIVKYTKEPIYVKGNKQKLEQILINLIENSCQALSSRKQAVKIEIKKNCENVLIKVSDEGVGIHPEILRNITDPFFTTKRNKGGTGLGLSIANKIINQHKGKLKFKSELGNGTNATIKIPLEQDINL